jgi:hypothetical protein
MRTLSGTVFVFAGLPSVQEKESLNEQNSRKELEPASAAMVSAQSSTQMLGDDLDRSSAYDERENFHAGGTFEERINTVTKMKSFLIDVERLRARPCSCSTRQKVLSMYTYFKLRYVHC